MAGADRQTVHPLTRELEERPQGFSFFQAVWLLERLHPGGAPLGESGPVATEAARLRPASALAFAAADVTSLERRAEAPPHELTTAVLGLYGATSPLPGYYSEDILRGEVEDEHDAVRLFLDVLNHRLLSLLYRAWLKYRWELSFRRDARDRTSQRLLGLLGLGTEGLQERFEIPAGRLLRYAGAISQRPRTAGALESVVGDYFGGIPVRVEACVHQWVEIAEEDRGRLGVRASTLGRDLTVGDRVPDRSGKLRLAIGPLDFGTWERLRPGGECWDELRALVRFVLTDPLEFDVRLELADREVPRPRLTASGEAAGAKLGWSLWLAEERERTKREVLFPVPFEATAA